MQMPAEGYNSDEVMNHPGSQPGGLQCQHDRLSSGTIKFDVANKSHGQLECSKDATVKNLLTSQAKGLHGCMAA